MDTTSQRGKLAAKPLFCDPVFDGAADSVVIWNRGEHTWPYRRKTRYEHAACVPVCGGGTSRLSRAPLSGVLTCADRGDSD